MKQRIYLDDVRTPIDEGWVIVRNYDEFVSTIEKIGFSNIELVSLDHDLGESAMKEWHNNVYNNYQLNYDNITEKTGYDCAKWLSNHCINNKLKLPLYNIQSANSVGKENIDMSNDR
jgi:hypothetical protein